MSGGSRHRVAVTGVGVVAPCGVGLDDFWNGLLIEASGSPRTIDDWDPSPWFSNPKEIRRADRYQQFAVAAAAQAWEHAGSPSQLSGPRAGTWVSSGIGGLATLEEQVLVLAERGARRVSPMLVPMMIANAAGAAISMRYGLQGPSENSVTACAAGTQSIANGARLIASGHCDLMVVGAAEAAVTPLSLAAFGNLTALSTSGRSCPFDVDRDGFVMSEGAAILVLERLDVAVERGATIHAEILGSGSTSDAHHITSPSPGGEGAVRAMRAALEDATLTADDIRQINAHGTSTPLNDMAESTAIATVFGTPGPPVTSIKGVTGHSLGAAGALEAVATVLSFAHRLIPPTLGTRSIDPELPALDYVVDAPRDWEPGPTLSNSFGFGGHNGCVIFGP